MAIHLNTVRGKLVVSQFGSIADNRRLYPEGMNVTFELPPAQAEKLRQTAEQLGIRLRSWLAPPSPTCWPNATTTSGELPTASCARTLICTGVSPERHLTLGEVVELHGRLIVVAGGTAGIRDLGLLESALAQPTATFAGADLHPTLVDKAVALAFGLVANHPFVVATSGSATRQWKCSWC